MKVEYVSNLPASVGIAPYNTGGNLCSAHRDAGFILNDGTVVECEQPSTWGNEAGCGPRKGMTGSTLERPVGAVASFAAESGSLNGRYARLTITVEGVADGWKTAEWAAETLLRWQPGLALAAIRAAMSGAA